jgi:hypothetical protein
LDVFNEYYSFCGQRLRWATNPANHRWEELTPSLLPDQWLLKNMETNHVWDFYYHGGRTYDESSAFRIHGLGFPIPARSLSYLSICFPVTWFAENNADAPSLIMHWCQRLNPFHGYAGFTILSSSDTRMESKMAKAVYTLAQRFPGLEVDYPVSHSMYLQEGIKGVNWLTCLEERWLKELGGIGELRQRLGDEFIFHEYDGGIVIQAGPYPEVGDRNRQIAVNLYGKLSHVLGAIRVEYPVPILGFDATSTAEWFHRFDEKS